MRTWLKGQLRSMRFTWVEPMGTVPYQNINAWYNKNVLIRHSLNRTPKVRSATLVELPANMRYLKNDAQLALGAPDAFVLGLLDGFFSICDGIVFRINSTVRRRRYCALRHGSQSTARWLSMPRTSRFIFPMCISESSLRGSRSLGLNGLKR